MGKLPSNRLKGELGRLPYKGPPLIYAVTYYIKPINIHRPIYEFFDGVKAGMVRFREVQANIDYAHPKCFPISERHKKQYLAIVADRIKRAAMSEDEILLENFKKQISEKGERRQAALMAQHNRNNGARQ